MDSSTKQALEGIAEAVHEFLSESGLEPKLSLTTTGRHKPVHIMVDFPDGARAEHTLQPPRRCCTTHQVLDQETGFNKLLTWLIETIEERQCDTDNE